MMPVCQGINITIIADTTKSTAETLISQKPTRFQPRNGNLGSIYKYDVRNKPDNIQRAIA
jgi:hypothetical protein